jgi:hypothetical protein
MKNMYEIMEERCEWQRLKREIKKIYESKDVQERHLENIQKFLSEIEISENWNVEYSGYDEGFYSDMYFYIFIKNEKRENIFCFVIELDTYGNDCRFTIYDITIYAGDYNISIDGDALEETNFSKLFKKYNELSKIFEEVKE